MNVAPKSPRPIPYLGSKRAPGAPSEIQESLNVTYRTRTSVLPWRGQFSPQLIEFLLSQHSSERVFDPFCGSGTVLYEAAYDRRASIEQSPRV